MRVPYENFIGTGLDFGTRAVVNFRVLENLLMTIER